MAKDGGIKTKLDEFVNSWKIESDCLNEGEEEHFMECELEREFLTRVEQWCKALREGKS